MSDKSSAKANRAAAEAKELRERKKYNIVIAVTLAVIVVLVLFTVLFSSNLFYNTTTAVKIAGDGHTDTYSVADFNYFYFTAYNTHYSQFSGYAQLLPDTSVPFDEQVCVFMGDGKSTWADYFETQAVNSMRQISMLCAEAAADSGFTLPQEAVDSIEETVESLTFTAAQYNYPDLNAYLIQLYGKGMNEKIFRRDLERQATAQAYLQYKQDSFTYTADELAAHYAENADDYDFFLFHYYFIPGAAVSDDASTEEDETLSAEDAMKKAEEQAAAFESAAVDEQAYIDYAASLNADNEDYDADSTTLRRVQGSNLTSGYTDAVHEWLVDPARKAGDTAVINTEEGATLPGCYVLYFMGRDNNQYLSVNGYYGFVALDAATSNVDPELEENRKEDAIRLLSTSQAQDILDDYTSLTDGDMDAFADVMEDEDNSTLISNSGELNQVGLYDGPKEVCDWLFDPARQEGDTTVIFVEGEGSYILYFSGTGDVYADLLSDAAMRSADTSEWLGTQTDLYTADTQWEMFLSKNLPSLRG